jgi:hypothetical protein
LSQDLTSNEVMSWAHLSRRLSDVRAGEEHLKTRLPVASAYNATLRLGDIVAYTHIPYPWLRRQMPDMRRFGFEHAPRPPPSGKEKPADRHEIEERQRVLSRFFYGWDCGTLIKARLGDEWRIVNRHPHPLALGAAARAPSDARVIGMRIDPATLGLRFK